MSGLSVVIPCRNGARFLPATLRSLINQTAPPAEIIVVDDGSQDDSAAIARLFGDRVRVIPGSEKGASPARRLGAQSARGERIAFVDADDLLAPESFAALHETLDRGPREAMAACPWDRLTLEGPAWVVSAPTAALRRFGQDPLSAWMTGTFFPTSCLMWTRAGYERAGGWDREPNPDDDGTLVRRALARGIKLLFAREGLMLYRRLPDGNVSLSQQRLTDWGARAQLGGWLDTRKELEAAGLLSRYRAELAAGLRRTADSAPEGSKAAEQARKAIVDLGAQPAALPFPDGSNSLSARMAHRVREWRVPRPSFADEPLRSLPLPQTRGPKVSVVIPTYNRREAVLRAVASVAAQTYEDFEIIVVDDGSADGTDHALQSLGEPRLRVIRQENAGVALARNAGIDAASGAYIAFLDSDDTWFPNKLATQLPALEASPAYVGLCYCTVRTEGAGSTTLHHARVGGNARERLLLSNVVHAPPSCLLVRRGVFDAVGGFDPRLPAIEDWDWLQRAAKLYHLLPVDEPLVAYADADASTDRRSRRFRANMDAREMLWQRNAHALRRAGLADLYLIESARRELREPAGDAARARQLVLRALAARPQETRHWPWLLYMMAPFRVRSWLRRIDVHSSPRRNGPRKGIDEPNAQGRA